MRLAASQAINIRVQIGGTLSRPRIALDSDAQPPISQSDLLSYLAFGRTSSSLLQFEGSSLSGGGGANNLAGAGAQLVDAAARGRCARACSSTSSRVRRRDRSAPRT